MFETLSDVDPTTILSKVRIVKDFPKPGINFVDISAITADRQLFQLVIHCLKAGLEQKGLIDFDIVAVESRGFIFGAALAQVLNKNLVLARKKGKLPSETYSKEYSLEYGSAEIELNRCDVREGAHYVLVDDIVATGGTLHAIEDIITSHGGIVDLNLVVFAIKDLLSRAEATLTQNIYYVAEF